MTRTAQITQAISARRQIRAHARAAESASISPSSSGTAGGRYSGAIVRNDQRSIRQVPATSRQADQAHARVRLTVA